jgi:purine-nucleoside phosphorylase
MNIDNYRENIKLAATKIKTYLQAVPDYAIILGSGLSSLADSLTDTIEVSYSDIPGFPEVTVAGHEGLLIIGKLCGSDVILLKGRFHYYEGHSIENVVFPIRVLLELGIGNLILTNAAGGVNKSYSPGDLMIIKDHIGFFCESPLRGMNFDEFGPRFPDQSYIYNFKPVKELSDKLNINAKTGVYSYAKGPMYETPAEIRMIAMLGADAVGMSTVPEAIVASHGGMNVIGISCITNFAAGILDQPLSHSEVMEVGLKSSENLKLLIKEIIKSKL